jgi:hypothetical protein
MVGSVLSKFPGLVVYFVIRLLLFAPNEQLTPPFLVIAQVPDEVYPTYDHGAFFSAGNFKSSLLPVERPLVIGDHLLVQRGLACRSCALRYRVTPNSPSC